MKPGDPEKNSAEKTDRFAEEEVSVVLRLLKKNRAAAMGMAVLFLTGALSGGCGLLVPPPNASTAVIQRALEDEEDEKDPYISGGSHSYFHSVGHPVMSGGHVMWGSAPVTRHVGGYAVVRGGSIGG